MINELFSLLAGLEHVGVKIATKHKDITSPGKGTALRVLLDEGGKVLRVELKDDPENCWTIGDGNKNQFPAIKLVAPLRLMGHQEYAGILKDNKVRNEKDYLTEINKLRQKCGLHLQSSWPTYRAKIAERGKLLEDLRGTRAEIVSLLYDRYLKFADSGFALLKEVDEKLWELCRAQGVEKKFLAFVGHIYFGSENSLEEKKSGELQFKDNQKVTFLLDVDPTDDGLYPAASNHWVEEISTVLSRSSTAEFKSGKCAITGLETALVTDKFPIETLPHIGRTNLYSKFSGSGNQAVLRYGKADVDGFPVGSSLTEKLAGALRKISSAELKGRTWAPVSSENNSSDLLIAYCKSPNEMNVVDPIVGQPSDPIDDFKDYEAICEDVFNSYKSKNIDLHELVNFFVIRKIDDGKQKIIYSATCSLERLRKASRDWGDGCKNVPPVVLPLYFKNEKKTLLSAPWAIFPEALVNLSAWKYGRGQKKKCDVPGFTFAEVMSLFFGERSDKQAGRMLLKMLAQYSSLIEGRVLAKRRWEDIKSDENRSALAVVTAIGSIMFKMGRRKEQYMNDLAYKLGQLFAAADELHIGYCVDQRDGSVPPKLIGNQAYGMALIKPKTALENLSRRWKVYQAWASKKKVSVDSERRILSAIYASRWMKSMAPEIQQKIDLLNNKPTALFRAELLLGYLAGRPIKKNSSKLKNIRKE